jgi:hypothetical protein
MTLPEATHKMIDSMRGTPALLAVIVLQLATLAVIWSVARDNSERQQTREMALIEACKVEGTNL